MLSCIQSLRSRTFRYSETKPNVHYFTKSY